MNGWLRLVIAMSGPGPGHVGGAHIKGAAMSGPGWAGGDQVFVWHSAPWY